MPLKDANGKTMEPDNAVESAAHAAVAGRITPDPLEAWYAKADERTQGEDVAVDADAEGGPRLFIRVFPVRYSHMDQFIDEVEGLVRKTVQAATTDFGIITPESFIAALPSVIPFIAGRASGMVAEACVAWGTTDGLKLPEEDGPRRALLNREYNVPGNRAGTPDLTRLPFHVQCACVEAWLRQSFMGDKLRPLAGMVETLMRVTGTKQLKIGDLWRRFSSDKGTSPEPSSAQPEPGPGGRIPGGVSPNSDGEPAPHSASTARS